MKTYTLNPLVWDKLGTSRWTAQGMTHTYTTQPEHHRVRLYCTPIGSDAPRADLYDFDSYFDAMTYAQEHHRQQALRFIKEVT